MSDKFKLFFLDETGARFQSVSTDPTVSSVFMTRRQWESAGMPVFTKADFAWVPSDVN